MLGSRLDAARRAASAAPPSCRTRPATYGTMRWDRIAVTPHQTGITAGAARLPAEPIPEHMSCACTRTCRNGRGPLAGEAAGSISLYEYGRARENLGGGWHVADSAWRGGLQSGLIRGNADAYRTTDGLAFRTLSSSTSLCSSQVRPTLGYSFLPKDSARAPRDPLPCRQGNVCSFPARPQIGEPSPAAQVCCTRLNLPEQTLADPQGGARCRGAAPPFPARSGTSEARAPGAPFAALGPNRRAAGTDRPRGPLPCPSRRPSRPLQGA